MVGLAPVSSMRRHREGGEVSDDLTNLSHKTSTEILNTSCGIPAVGECGGVFCGGDISGEGLFYVRVTIKRFLKF